MHGTLEPSPAGVLDALTEAELSLGKQSLCPGSPRAALGWVDGIASGTDHLSGMIWPGLDYLRFIKVLLDLSIF